MTEETAAEVEEETTGLEGIPPELLEQLQAGAKVVYQDLYNVECKSFDGEAIKRVDLPKYIMKPTSTRPAPHDKSNLLLTFHGEPHLYPQMAKAMLEGTKKITVTILAEEEENNSQWVFLDPRIHAIDFGNLAGQREDTREISVEFAYKKIRINDVEFTTS